MGEPRELRHDAVAEAPFPRTVAEAERPAPRSHAAATALDIDFQAGDGTVKTITFRYRPLRFTVVHRLPVKVSKLEVGADPEIEVGMTILSFNGYKSDSFANYDEFFEAFAKQLTRLPRSQFNPRSTEGAQTPPRSPR